MSSSRLRWRLSVALAFCALFVAGCAAGTSPAPPALKQTTTLTIAVMGASDAWGIGTHDPDRVNWPSLLVGSLPQVTHLINLGEPGATLAQAMRSELPVVLGEHPDVVVIWLAINDIIDSVPLSVYSSELRLTLATIQRQSPHSHVFVGNVPDLTQLPFFTNRDQAVLRAQVSDWNSAIARSCSTTGSALVDIYKAWGQQGDHSSYISGDGLHPSDVGAEALARVFRVAIEQSLDSRA